MAYSASPDIARRRHSLGVDFRRNFNAFELIYATQGALAGPNFASDILGTFFFRTFFGYQLQPADPYMGSTIAGIMLLVILTGVSKRSQLIQRFSFILRWRFCLFSSLSLTHSRIGSPFSASRMRFRLLKPLPWTDTGRFIRRPVSICSSLTVFW